MAVSLLGKVFAVVFIAVQTGRLTAFEQVRVEDIFGRPLNSHGITLVDWDGYMANPLIKVYLLPPLGVPLPAFATLTINNSRLYFEEHSSVGPNGPRKTILFSRSAQRV